MHPTRALVVLLAFVGVVVAQGGCAHERAERVPAAQKMNGRQPCGSGLVIVVRGIKVGNKQICPGNIIVTPTHDKSVRTDRQTFTETTRVVPELFISYYCDVRRLIGLITLSSSCASRPPVVFGGVPFMRTVGCDSAEPQTAQ